jgi:predicted dienelactone hydrolase
MQIARVAALAVVFTLGPAAAAFADEFPVGHRVEQLVVPSSAPGSVRPVKVHLWYPAEEQGLSASPQTEYTSALYGRELAGLGDALGWRIQAEIAHETDAIDQRGNPFPVIVFSHGSTNDPIDYARTLERIAAEGFVVAAPYHVNNTQDDVRLDFVNSEAVRAARPVPFPRCDDGLEWSQTSPCARISVPTSMQERVRDISYILDAVPAWFGDRADAARAGVIGHSRGTVSALAAAGGSTTWGIKPEDRVKAVMGLAIGGRNITFLVDLAKVKVPAVLVAGGLDTNSVQAVSEDAFAALKSTDKLFVAIPNATHRSFDSTYCAQLQSAGAIVQGDHDPSLAPILDLHTVRLIAASPPLGASGKAVHYCAAEFFTKPMDIGPLVGSIPQSEFPPSVGPPSVCLTTSIPCTGLETEEVKHGVKEIAVTFFDTALKREGNDAIHFTRYLAPKWLLEHVPMVGDAAAYAGADSICPPGQGVICPTKAESSAGPDRGGMTPVAAHRNLRTTQQTRRIDLAQTPPSLWRSGRQWRPVPGARWSSNAGALADPRRRLLSCECGTITSARPDTISSGRGSSSRASAMTRRTPGLPRGRRSSARPVRRRSRVRLAELGLGLDRSRSAPRGSMRRRC